MIKGLRWDDGAFEPVGTIDEISGCVVGLAFQDVDGAGSPELVLALAKEGAPLSLAGGTSSIRIYFRK